MPSRAIPLFKDHVLSVVVERNLANCDQGKLRLFELLPRHCPWRLVVWQVQALVSLFLLLRMNTPHRFCFPKQQENR